MRVLKGAFIEFGDFVICGDKYPIAIVSGDYEILDMTKEQLNEAYNFDWIDLDLYKGEIVFTKSREELGL